MPPSSIQDTIDAALRHHHAGRLRQAAALYRRVLRQEPGHARALHLLGVLAHQVGRPDDALALLRHAVAADPGDPAAHEDLGNHHFTRGRFDEAAACFRAAVALENRAAAHAQLGAALAKLGRHADAVDAYRRAVDATGLLRAPGASVRIAVDDAAPAGTGQAGANGSGHAGATDAADGNAADVLGRIGHLSNGGARVASSPGALVAARATVAGNGDLGAIGSDEGMAAVEPGEVGAVEPTPRAWPAPDADSVAAFLAPEPDAGMPPPPPVDPHWIAAEPAGSHVSPPADHGAAVVNATNDFGAPAEPVADGFAAGDVEPFVAFGPADVDPADDPAFAAHTWAGHTGTATATPLDLSGAADASDAADATADATADVTDPEILETLALSPRASVFEGTDEPVADVSGSDEGASARSPHEAAADLALAPPAARDEGRAKPSGDHPASGAAPVGDAGDAADDVWALLDVSAADDDYDDLDEVPDPAVADGGGEPLDDVTRDSTADPTDAAPPAPPAASAPSAAAADDDAAHVALHRARQLRKARAKAKRKPTVAGDLRRRADALLRHRKPDEAVALYERVVELTPASAKARRDLGAAYLRDQRLEDAVASLQKALELRPRFADAYASLGDAYHLLGKLDLAIACYRKVLRLQPHAARANSNLLLTLNYHHKVDPAAVFREHLAWAERHAKPAAGDAPPPPPAHANVPDRDRRLRIGYVSPDFRRHSVNYFIEPVLARHDHARHALFCYSDAIRPDDVTERIAGYCDGWRDVRGMGDGEVAQLVRDDAIDVLVDLSGHTGTNRLGAFARKPAPVQVSYLGYPNTTGLAAIDYRITDAHADPPGMTEHLFTERLVRVAGAFVCYAPPPDAPPVARPPCLLGDGRPVTFGCFNILAKVTPEVMAVWARVLAAVPGSRLLMKDRIGSFGYAGRRRYVQDIFRYHGVDADRLELLPKEADYARHLDTYAQVDVMLDPFPYAGTTTTCEALWMGVPVVTLAGQTHAARVGVSLLSNLDLQALIAGNAPDYIRKAAELARDPDQLLFLRETLRERMARSTLLDADAFARRLETAYRHMWYTWCRAAAGNPSVRPGEPGDTGMVLSLRDE